MVYAAFASLWILLSDRLMAWLFSEPSTILLVSMIKGWLFVGVTSLLLFGLISRLLVGLNRSIETIEQRERDLHQSTRLLRETQRIAGLGSYELDLRLGVWKNSLMCDAVLGIDERFAHTPDGWASLIHPEERSSMVEYFQNEVIAKGLAFDREYRIVRPSDQAVRWVHGLGQTELDSQGRALTMHGTIADITEKKQAELEVMAARDRLQATLDALPDLLFEVGLDGRIYRYHSHQSDLLAAPPEAFLGKTLDEVVPADVAQVSQLAIREASELGYSSGRTYPLDFPSGRRWFELSVAPMHAGKNPDQHFIVIARDITERKAANEKLHLAARVFSHAREGITITDAEGTILDVNEAFTRITGYSREEAIGQNQRLLRSTRHSDEFFASMWRDLLDSGNWSGEMWNRRKNGEVFPELLTISAVRDAQGNIVQYVALFTDITAIKEHQDQLEHIAHFDTLTSLPNRLLLADRLRQAMSQAQRRNQHVAVAYLDLDGFKAANDRHGHAVGDRLLVALAMRMRDTLREGDTLARMGGDEFVAVLTDLENVGSSLPMLTRLLGAAAEPVAIAELSLKVSASLGVTFYPQSQELDADQLLRQADQAMYQAKLSGKNRYHIFDAEQDSSIRGHHESIERIRQALERHEFVLHFQPKVNMRTGHVVGAEALIRWQHPDRGLLPPVAFLPAIEDHPLAIAVGEWVIATALTEVARWRELGLDIPISVNVGAHQLQQADFVDRLRALLAKHPGLAPSRLELEILETSALNDITQVSQVIEDCERIGVTFALDDFGTGYSSLTYLKRLKVRLLKIDQSFVRGMLDDPDDLAILEGVIGLASAFKCGVIAEGMETAAHGAMLLKLGCDLAQGYGIARPMPGDAIPAWSATWRPDPSW
jgi:diguanylate cyclase (GGDEF)-like protein/PAS domain S-box-containing protein